MVGLTGLFGPAAVRGLNASGLRSHLPASYLLFTLPIDDSATIELQRRFESGELTASQRGRLIQRLLDLQQDPATAWKRGWGDMIEATWEAGALSPTDAERYLRQGVGFRTWVRPQVQQGWQAEVELEPVTRLGSELGVFGGTATFMPNAGQPASRTAPNAGINDEEPEPETVIREFLGLDTTAQPGRVTLRTSVTGNVVLPSYEPGGGRLEIQNVQWPVADTVFEVVARPTGAYADGPAVADRVRQGFSIYWTYARNRADGQWVHTRYLEVAMQEVPDLLTATPRSTHVPSQMRPSINHPTRRVAS